MRSGTTLQRKLFIIFSGVILAVVASAATLYYVGMHRSLDEGAFSALTAAAGQVAFHLESTIQDANSLSVRALYSDSVKANFYADMFTSNSSASQQRRFEFNEAMYRALGPDIPNHQISLYRTGGEYASIGYYPLIARISPNLLEKVTYLDACAALDGAKLVLPTHENPLLKRFSPIISVVRAFGRTWASPKDSFIEVQMRYSDIASAIELRAESTRITVLDPGGAVVYPYETSFDNDRRAFTPDALARYRDDAGRMVAACARVPSADWLVIAAQREDVLYAPLLQFQWIVPLASIALLAAMLLLASRLSRRLTAPICRLRDTAAELSASTLPAAQALEVETGLMELDQLNIAFKRMCVRLEDSMQACVDARSAEVQSRFLALQSQMNPHFLHNTLTTISILSEAGESQKVCQVCELLSDMLRYCATGGQSLVSIERELEHTQAYIELIKLRFEDDAHFYTQIDPQMLTLHIPRLSIQPLVENCTKYAFAQKPPWHIRIVGMVVDGAWRIRVSDDGPGFAPDQLEALCARVAHARALSRAQALTPDGMGLANIYARLCLLYGESTHFDFGNEEIRGAFVEIGGPIGGVRP